MVIVRFPLVALFVQKGQQILHLSLLLENGQTVNPTLPAFLA